MTQVKLTTSLGEIVIDLYQDKAPNTVANFLNYVEDKHYDGTIFHRVIPGFMIQGGGFASGLEQKPTKDPIENEAKQSVSNEKYTVAMARLPSPHSATCQFFINGANNTFLDPEQSADGWGYCVFGKVSQGEDVVDKISQVSTGSMMGYQDVPHDEVIVEKAELLAS